MKNQWYDLYTLDSYDQSQSNHHKKSINQSVSNLSGASLTIILLLALTPAPDVQALVISNIDPIAIGPLQNYVKSNVFSYTSPGSTQASSNTTITSAPVNLTGSLTDTNAGVTYTIGTSHDSNPTFGLDFFAKGTANFDFLWPVTVKHDAPERIAPGQKFTLNPYVDLTTTNPTMTVTQNINWGTEFFSSYEDNSKLHDFSYDFSINLPDINVPGAGNINLNLTGSDTMNSTSSSFTANRSAGNGVGTVTTDSSEVDAWSITADLLNIVNEYVPLEPVSKTAVALADLIFDLDLTLGLDIHRVDQLTLSNFNFSDSSSDTSSPVTIFTPDDTQPGSLFKYEFDSRLSYDASITSLYYYGGQASLSLDAPLLDPLELVSGDFGNKLVGASQLLFDDLEMDIPLFGQAFVNDGRCNRDGEFCFFRSDMLPSLSQRPVINSPPTVQPGNTIVVDYASNNVPEPATWSLMLFSLLGFIHRKKNSGASKDLPLITA